MCDIFQMITDFQIFIFFTKVNLHPSFISKKMLIFIAVTFRNTFSTFLLVLTVGKLFNNSNKYQLFNKSGNNFFFYIADLTSVFYFKKCLILSVVEVSITIRFWPNFYKFGEWLRCVIYRMCTTFLTCQPYIGIFTQETRVLLFKKWLVFSIVKVFRNINKSFSPYFFCSLQR